LVGRKMPTYADQGGLVISTISGWFLLTADTSSGSRANRYSARGSN
jgi:hypothetical protein